MEKIDAKAVKERILRLLEEKGPSLPVQVAKVVGLNTIFTSAFLSELASESLIKISDMKVGGSPLYYPESKKAMLENFFQYLNPKENEAVKLLKEKSFLVDVEQEPAIRVALRSLKDFAFILNNNGKTIWRYYLASESNMSKTEVNTETKAESKIEVKETLEKLESNAPEVKAERVEKDNADLQDIKKELEEKRKELEKLKNELSLQSKPASSKKEKKKIIKKEKPRKDEFLEQIKKLLVERSREIINVEEFDKKYAFLRVRDKDKELLIAAFDKKKLEDSDLIKIARKAAILGLKYSIIFKGELSKKTKEAIEAYKSLDSTEKIS